MKLSSALLVTVLLLFLVEYSAAQPRQDVSPGGNVVSIPASAEAVLAIDLNGKAVILDKQGKHIPACQVCNEKMEEIYGSHCEQADQRNICGALTKATVQEVETITLIRSHKNPTCMSVILGGRLYSVPIPCI